MLAADSLDELASRVAQLGRECPWTVVQTPRSVLAYLREECDELEAALDSTAPREEICSELGDILFNTLLAVEVCARDCSSGSDDAIVSLERAASASVAKLRRRYPPLFDGSLATISAEEAGRVWVAGKADEAAESGAVAEAACWDEEDAALAAEIAELDRLEQLDAERAGRQQEMAERERLARLVMEEIAREAADDE